MMKEGWLWWGDKMVHCVGTSYRPTLGKVGCVGRPLQGFQGFCILRCEVARVPCRGARMCGSDGNAENSRRHSSTY